MTYPDADLTRDAFLGGAIRLWQPRKGYRAAIDPVLLAAFVPARPGERVLDLGCGAGTAALCLAARVPGLDLHGLELQPDYADLARRNAEANGIRLAVHEGDLRRPSTDLRALQFDHVLANPPFHEPRSAAGSPDRGRDLANRETEAGLADWIDAGLRRLRPGGWFVLIHRTARLGEILAAFQGRAGAVDILPLAPRAGQPAQRLLVRARKGSCGTLRLLSSLIVHAGSCHSVYQGAYTVEVAAIMRSPLELLPDTR